MTEKEVLLAEDTLNKRLEQTELALVLAKSCLAREQELIDLAVKRWGNLPVLERKKHSIQVWFKHLSEFAQNHYNLRLPYNGGESSYPL